MSERKIGDYCYDEKQHALGEGSFGIVFLGRHHQHQHKKVAIKSIKLGRLSPRRISIEMLETEIKILQAVSSQKSPNLVSLLSFIKGKSTIYMVMEYCNGGDFRKYLKAKKTLKEPVIRQFSLQIATGMKVLHDQNILHRDLKPENILLCFNGERYPTSKNIVLKIADFGLGKFLPPDGQAVTYCGTYIYMAPEIRQNLRYDRKVDMWSIGVMVFECLTGIVRESDLSDIKSSLPCDASKEIRKMLPKLLTQLPRDRFDCDQLLADRFMKQSERKASNSDNAADSGFESLGTAKWNKRTQFQDVPKEGERSARNSDNANTYNGKEILEVLELTSYNPSKLSYSEATTIKDEDLDLRETNSACGLVLVKRLLRFDYTALEDITSELNETNNSNDAAARNISPKRFTFQRNVSHSKKLLHQMDAMTVLLSCCDDSLRQILAEKLVSANISLPILVTLLNPLPEISAAPLVLNRTLRSIVLESSNSAMEKKHFLNVPNPIISFIRIGNLHRSKSKLLCSFLSKISHNAFYHRKCANGSAKRGLTNGCIEVTWFQSPSNSDVNYQFNCNFFTILNLRGDATDFPKQAKLLCESSSLVVIMTDSVDALSCFSRAVLKKVNWTRSKMAIAVVSENSHECFDELETFSEKWSLSEQVIDITTDSMDGEPMSFIEWRRSIRKIIKNFMDQNQTRGCFTLDDFINNAKSFGFKLEDDGDEYDDVKIIANIFVNYFQKKHASKSPIFPLQGQSIKKLAELEKTIVRNSLENNESVETFVSRTQNEMDCYREKQCTMIRGFTKWERDFFKTLCSLKESDFVNSLVLSKMGLDAKSENDDAIVLETIVRELGQIYEATHSDWWSKSSPSDSLIGLPKTIVNMFPLRVAELLIRGHPLELLNGEASYVPKLWIEAVFSRVAEIAKNGKVFVLSVVGVQSSGKSTLLNALFGLHFPTSAGRCTRGLYCHLLPIDKTSVNSECDYVMVLDVEGFRAPEFSATSTVRDNEMATFIVGLSDLTIVNVEGEIWSDMEDILQIVVYALLRIKQTKHNVKFMPSCVFVHQKVSAADFREKTKHGRVEQMKFINKMVADSAKKEGYGMITAFSDVIAFNGDTDSHSLPNMWNGNPPFGTFNPDYCRAIVELRKALMKKIKTKTSCLNFEDLYIRISDLWGAILKETFVFNFRCTREALAYQSLSATFSEIEWNLRNSNHRIVTVVINKILSLGKSEDLGQKRDQFYFEIREKLTESSKEADDSLQRALSSVQYEDIAARLRESFVNQLRYVKEAEIVKANDTVRNGFNIQRTKLENCKEIEIKLRSLISRASIRRKMQSSDFDERWESQFSEEKEKYEQSKIQAMETIDDAVRKHLPREALKIYTEKVSSSDSNLNVSPPEVSEKDIHSKALDLAKDAIEILPTVLANDMCKEVFNKCKIHLESVRELDFNESHVETLFQIVSEYFGMTISKASASFKSNETASHGRDSPPEQTDGYEFSSGLNLKKGFIGKYFAFIGRYACNELKSFKVNFIENTNAYFVIKKRHQQSIKDMMQSRHKPEFMLAKYILQETERVVFGGLIVSNILQEHNKCFQNKKSFIAKLLTDLSYKKNASDFFQFFTDFEGFCLDALRRDIQDIMKDDAIRLKIDRCMYADIQVLIKKVQEDIISSLDECNDSLENWLNCFLIKLDGKIAFRPEDVMIYFTDFYSSLKEKSILVFPELIKVMGSRDTYMKTLRKIVDHLNNLDALYNSKICANSQLTADISEKVKSECEDYCARKMYEKLSGCCAKCPFCSAPCLEETNDHVSSGQLHQSLHYPIGIRGAVVGKNGWFPNWTQHTTSLLGTNDAKLILEWCPLLIQSRNSFRSDYTVKKYHKWYPRFLKRNYINYKDYKKEFPDWHIPLMSDMKPEANDYWKWLLTKFGQDFAQKYNVSFPKIDPNWRRIERQTAVDSIRTLLLNNQ